MPALLPIIFMLNLGHFWVKVRGKTPKPLILLTYTLFLCRCDSKIPAATHQAFWKATGNNRDDEDNWNTSRWIIITSDGFDQLSFTLSFWGAVYIKSAVASSNLVSHYYWEPVPLVSKQATEPMTNVASGQDSHLLSWICRVDTFLSEVKSMMQDAPAVASCTMCC